MFKDFKEFAMKGNIMDMAVGVIIGGAFGKIVASLVDDIIMPLVGLLLGGTDFTNLFITLDGSSYSSWEAAKNAGAATLNYGIFLSAIIDFLIISGSIFIVIRQMSKFKKEEVEEETTKECPYCISEIDIEASRCPNCTSELNKTIA